MQTNQTNNTKGWLAFELTVLKRLKFGSVAMPFANDAGLGSYLKRWNVCVHANDLTLTGWTKSVASIQNNGEVLSDEDIETVLEDAYVPGYRLMNPALRNWFGETDAWWFDNVRRNIERLGSPVRRGIAATIALAVGDYALSFDESTRELRQPLSTVFRRLRTSFPAPVNNNQANTSSNMNGYDFIAESFRSELMFLRLPKAHNLNQKNYLGWTAWREEWLRGGGDFWSELEFRQAGRLGTSCETKSQYLRLVEELLRTAAHIKLWAIAQTDDGYVTTQELVETIGNVRRVDTIYTKDFSELTGAKAVIITA
ncbi:MAG: hypothetical protein IPK58_18840 [Acidobacteria bacterium]|nr:hypothetical protein [Acidobacteriota bacterium]